MLRIAAAEDLTALTRLRRAATGDSAEDAAGWLQRVAGLENILLLEKPGAPPALMLAAVPVHYAHRKGIWFTGLAADKGVPADKLLPKLLEGALRAFAENGCDFAVMTPDTAADASHLADLGFKNLLPLRVVSKPIRRNLLAQAQFDSLTVRHLMERRLRCQPGCITLPETAMNEMMTQLYRRGLTVVSDRRGYGLYYTKGDTLQFIELQADNDHCADQLLQAAREKTGAENARVLLAENQTLYLGAGRRCGYSFSANRTYFASYFFIYVPLAPCTALPCKNQQF